MKRLLLFCLSISFITIFFFAARELFHKNNGESVAVGKVHDGHLQNGYLMPFRGENFKYFSFISYYLMDNAYVHSKVYKTVLDSYEDLSLKYPDQKFQIMECSGKNGGKLKLHNTHRNGLSIDFLVPKKGKGYQYNNIGLLHYLLEFDEDGKLEKNKKIEIDFQMMAEHILSLQNAGASYGVRIKKVILKINLKDDLWNSASGKKLKQSGIYFAKNLNKSIDDMHDDHYHIDFEIM